MPITLECPGCKATLMVPDELAGKQGKCIHCGHRLTVPSVSRPGAGSSAIFQSAPPPPRPAAPASTSAIHQPAPNPRPAPSPTPAPAPVAPPAGNVTASASFSGIGGSLSPSLFEATPESMLRELYRRGQSAFMLTFPVPPQGSYDLTTIGEADLKCIATEDINQARFAQLVTSFAQRYGPRRRPGSQSMTAEEMLYELKGDRLGMTLEEFKQKYERSGEGGVRMPLCSDTAWAANKASLRSEPWHQKAGIITARIDLPSEDNSPTVAGVKTELLLYQFVDGKLFRIAALLPTDKFHLFSEAAISKYGPVTRETQKPRQLVWENPLAWVALTRGSVHPPEPSVLELVVRELQKLADSRMPSGASDF